MNDEKCRLIKGETIFAELANTYTKIAKLENKLIDLYHKELNLSTAPEKYNYYPANNHESHTSFDGPIECQNIINERKIGNLIITYPASPDLPIPENKTQILQIKNQKLKLLKQLNTLTKKLNILERQYSTLTPKPFHPFES